jgi:hypothetical protein
MVETGRKEIIIMTPEQLAETIKRTPGLNIRSVILYGSAAAGDHAGRRSDFNILVVLETLGITELDAISRIAAQWAAKGNPPPLLFTTDQLRRSADVFPIELLDMKECHRILAGEDVLSGIAVDRENLRLQIEHELKGKLIQLREQYMLAGGRSRAIKELMLRSLSPFLVLFRAALRLFQETVPARKMDALDALARHIGYKPDVFVELRRAKEGAAPLSAADLHGLFARYLAAVEKVTAAVDEHLQKSA